MWERKRERKRRGGCSNLKLDLVGGGGGVRWGHIHFLEGFQGWGLDDIEDRDDLWVCLRIGNTRRQHKKNRKG